MTPGLVWRASPLVSFQLPSADSRFTLRAMALSDPVWKAWTTATELTPAATPRTTLPKRPDVFPGLAEQVLPAADLQSASERAVVENFSAVTGLRVRDKPTAGFRAQWGLPGDSTCLNLTPTPWKLARTRDRGTLQCGRRLDICSAMFEQHRTNGLGARGTHNVTTNTCGVSLSIYIRSNLLFFQLPDLELRPAIMCHIRFGWNVPLSGGTRGELKWFAALCFCHQMAFRLGNVV